VNTAKAARGTEWFLISNLWLAEVLVSLEQAASKRTSELRKHDTHEPKPTARQLHYTSEANLYLCCLNDYLAFSTVHEFYYNAILR
jgi:hypothetical protein